MQQKAINYEFGAEMTKSFFVIKVYSVHVISLYNELGQVFTYEIVAHCFQMPGFKLAIPAKLRHVVHPFEVCHILKRFYSNFSYRGCTLVVRFYFQEYYVQILKLFH